MYLEVVSTQLIIIHYVYEYITKASLLMAMGRIGRLIYVPIRVRNLLFCENTYLTYLGYIRDAEGELKEHTTKSYRH